jgi:hypothetical protein
MRSAVAENGRFKELRCELHKRRVCPQFPSLREQLAWTIVNNGLGLVDSLLNHRLP